MREEVVYGTVTPLGDGYTVVVFGEPAPQGSKVVAAYGSVRESNVRTEGWRAAIKKVCQEKMPPGAQPLDGPIHVDFTFLFAPPKGARRGDLPSTKWTYDGDKLQRAMSDGLTDGGVIHDDARIVEWAGRKRFVWPDEGEPRAIAVVTPYVPSPHV